MLDNAPNQPTKFRTKQWVEINYYARGTYNTNNQIKVKASMLKSSLCDAYINISIEDTSAAGAAASNTNKKLMLKNYVLFIDCIIEINNIQVDNAKDIDVVMPMYRDKLSLNAANGAIVDFSDANHNSKSFNINKKNQL